MDYALNFLSGIFSNQITPMCIKFRSESTAGYINSVKTNVTEKLKRTVVGSVSAINAAYVTGFANLNGHKHG